MAWLARIATNIHIDGLRRARPAHCDLPERAAAPTIDPLEVRDALKEASQLLPPQEQACILLKDVFDLPLKEIAAMLSTTEGASRPRPPRRYGAGNHAGPAPIARSDGP